MDIERYLNRINYQGAREPTLQVLQQLQLAHLMTVPFENLDIHYQRKIVLEPERLFTKVMHNNRGGFCYELNGLFSELLRAFGFEVTQISARVWSDSKKAWPPEFDHMALLVHIDGSIYMTDVGFGDSFFVPLRLTPDLIQRDRKGLYRIRQYDSTYQLLEYFSEEKWTNCYIFTEVPRQLEDFAERCDWQQTAPDSHFRKNKLITLPNDTGRVTLTDKELKITTGFEKKIIPVSDVADFEEKLWSYFKVRMES